MGPTNHTRKKAETLQARRDHAARLFADDVPQAEVARRVGVTPGAVCRWHRIWKRKGAEGLRIKGRWGPSPQLPAYAPELNPVEALWAWTKQGDFANTAIDGLGEVAERVRGSARRCRRRNALLLGFLAKAGLSL